AELNNFFNTESKIYCFKISLFVRDFVTYELSNFWHKLATIFGAVTLMAISFARQFFLLRTLSLLEPLNKRLWIFTCGIGFLPENGLHIPCCFNNACILMPNT